MNENQEKKKRDSFWWGFAPALIIPFIIILGIIMNNTEKDIWYIMSKLLIIIRNNGISRLMISILPNLIMLFLFYSLEKDKAIGGAFVGTVPYLLLLFLVF